MNRASGVAVWTAAFVGWVVLLVAADIVFAPALFEPFGTLLMLALASGVFHGAVLFGVSAVLVVILRRLLAGVPHPALAVTAGLAVWLLHGLGTLAAFRAGGTFTLGPIRWGAPTTHSISPWLPAIFFGITYVLPAALALLGALLGWVLSRRPVTRPASV